MIARRITPPTASDITGNDFSPDRRALRIVAHNSLYPLLSETYIGDELEALRRNGVDLVLSRDQPAIVPTSSRIDVPLYESLHEAISQHEPDLVLMHWATTALGAMNRCALARVPFAVRTHSFDWTIDDAALLSPWCLGLWHLPHRHEVRPRVFQLPTLIVDDAPPKVEAVQRSRSVLSVSAGLPKKDWPMLIDAMSMVDNAPLEVIVATTNGFGGISREIANIARSRQVHCNVDVDVPYEEVQARLALHGAFVYSIGSDIPVGQPRSVIEGAMNGIPLVVPDHPGIRRITGDVAHFYRAGDSHSLSDAIREALDSPIPLPARRELARRVVEAHASPHVFEKWTASITDAYLDWKKMVASNAWN